MVLFTWICLRFHGLGISSDFCEDVHLDSFSGILIWDFLVFSFLVLFVCCSCVICDVYSFKKSYGTCVWVCFLLMGMFMLDVLIGMFFVCSMFFSVFCSSFLRFFFKLGLLLEFYTFVCWFQGDKIIVSVIEVCWGYFLSLGFQWDSWLCVFIWFILWFLFIFFA